VLGAAIEARKTSSDFELLNKVVSGWRHVCVVNERTAASRVKLLTA
jgi:hypothetical protein